MKKILLGLIIVTSANAEELSLPQVWQQISGKSHAQAAARLDSEATGAAKDRTARHWLPRVYAGANSYLTNDPGASFFGLIEQRSINQSDFLVDAVNNPDAKHLTKGTLGLDLPLFEGGLKVSEHAMQSHLYLAKEKEVDRVKLEQYSEVAKTFGTYALLSEQKEKISQLAKTIERLIKNYQIGNRSNPVGYSGLLGMKSLANRLSGLLQQYEGQSQASQGALREMGLIQNGNWHPHFSGVVPFVDQFLRVEEFQSSAQIESLKEKARAAEEMSGMEKARFLPKVGAFAESYLFNGNRATANGYTAGLYLQWSLFNPTDYGTLRESELRKAAAGQYADAVGDRERAEFSGLQSSAKAMRENLRLIEDSQKLMTEQTQVAEGLFRNGSINALQFVEVLSRRTDLIAAHTDVALGLLQVESQKVTRTQFEIPAAVEGK